jgi:hypothetical protein
MPYHDPIEYDDVLDGHNDEDMFPNHGKVVCVKALHDNCGCLRCKPRDRRYWRISRCKYGPNPWLKIDAGEEPRGCYWLIHPNDYYCKEHCPKFDARTKAQAFKEIYGYRTKLSMKWHSVFDQLKEIEEEVDRIWPSKMGGL